MLKYVRVIIIPLFMWGFVWASSIEKFHVCSVANRLDFPGYFFLEHTADRAGVDIEIIGLEKPYYKNGCKCVYMREYLDSLEDDDIVMLIDAFDVALIQDKARILAKFLAMERPLVFSGEKCMVHQKKYERVFPPSHFRYLNMGGYIGYVKFIKEWLDSLAIDPYQNETEQVYPHYLLHPEFYYVDTKCEIFLSLHSVEEREIEIGLDGAVFVKELGTYPGVIHANGRSFGLLIPIYKRFMKNHPSLK